MKTNIVGDYLYQKAAEKSKSVIDWVIPDGIINSFNKNNKPLYIILVYAKNMEIEDNKPDYLLNTNDKTKKI